MEEWQRDCIQKNLDKLIDLTKVNTQFLAIMERDCVLSKEEAAILCNDNKTDMQKAMFMYDVVMTRMGSFSKLKRALFQTKQSGAFQLLHNPDSDHYVQCEMLKYEKENPVYITGNTITVYKGKFGARNVLVKIFDNESSSSLEQAENELDMLSILDWHESILRCFMGKLITCEFSHYHRFFAIALDYKHTLEDLYCSEEEGHNIPVEISNSLLTQVVDGMSFLHERNILHLNMQPESILISYRDESCVRAKVGEFGLARQLTSEETATQISLKLLMETGAGSYFTPEVIQYCRGKHSRYQFDGVGVDVSFKTDVFCLGGIIYYILSSGSHPFGGIIERPVKIRNDQPFVDEQYVVGMSESWQSNFRKTLSRLPEDRPDVKVLHL